MFLRSPGGYHRPRVTAWTFIFMMVVLKIPVAALLWIVWWAIHATPDPEPAEDGGDGGTRRPREPRGPRPRPPRRGPHGEPPVPAPPRTRPAAARSARPERTA